MMRVCHITSAHSSNDTRIFHKECTSLAKAGYETYFVVPGDSDEINGVKIIGVHKPKSRVIRMLKTTNEVYQKAIEVNADVYHLHDPELLPYALKLKSLGKIIIFDSHENYTGSIIQKKWIPKIFRKHTQKIFNSYYFKVLKKIDAIVAVPHNYEVLKQINQTICIANYPVIADTDVNIKYSFSRDVCFAGGITNQWSHENILKAIALCKNTKYRLCGYAEKKYFNKLILGTEWENVVYLGLIPYIKVPEILKSSGIGMALLKPSNNTNGMIGSLSNTKLFEYMLAGIPFICTDFVLWKKLVEEENRCGLCVDPENIEEIAQAINYLLDNPCIAKQMGDNGRRAVWEKYNWGIEEKKLLKLYEELLR